MTLINKPLATPKPPRRPFTKTVNRIIAVCYAIIATLTVIGVIGAANMTLVGAAVTASLCVWVIAFFVWLLAGGEGAPWA